MTDRLESRSDSELLDLSLAGEEGAFLLLYARLKGPLFRYAFYATNSRAASEEIVQEVFISLLKTKDRYKPMQGELAGFAFGIARNLVRRLKKRERLYEELPGEEALQKLAGAQTALDHLSAAMLEQRIKGIRTAIASLPEHYRQVVVLCDLCELTYREAASRLQCAVGTIRSRLNRAHSLLAQKLRETKKPQPALPVAGKEECLI